MVENQRNHSRISYPDISISQPSKMKIVSAQNVNVVSAIAILLFQT